MLRRKLGLGALMFAVGFGLASAPPAFADSTKKTVESVASMLKEAKYKFTQNGATFTLEFEAAGMGKFPIIIAITDDMLTMLAYVAPAAKITKSPDLAAGLLAANNDYAFLKIMFDPKGNLIFRYDAFENMIDADDLKKLIKMMVDNSVNMYKNAPFIKK